MFDEGYARLRPSVPQDVDDDPVALMGALAVALMRGPLQEYPLALVYWIALGAGPDAGSAALGVEGSGPFVTDDPVIIHAVFRAMTAADPVCHGKLCVRSGFVLLEADRVGSREIRRGYFIQEGTGRALPPRVRVHSAEDVRWLCQGAQPFRVNLCSVYAA